MGAVAVRYLTGFEDDKDVTVICASAGLRRHKGPRMYAVAALVQIELAQLPPSLSRTPRVRVIGPWCVLPLANAAGDFGY